MTNETDNLNRSTPEPAAGASYAVGYGKPPIEHRFRKGKSGNPGGKPKVKPATTALPQLPAGSLHEMLMLEARRPVRVKAGGRMVEIPAIQAAFRELGMKAANGNRIAVATLAQLMLRSEAARSGAGPARTEEPELRLGEIIAKARHRQDNPVLAAAEEYKQIWPAVLTEVAQLEAEIAAPDPHPDDVAIGLVRRAAHWPGAQPDETLSLDRLAATHAELQDQLPLRRAEIEAMAEGYDKAVAWGQWFAQDDVRQLIARHLPSRYAGQIAPDDRSGEEMMRDRQLRSMAQYDRERHERQQAYDAERGISEPASAAEPAAVELAQDPAQTVAEAEVYCLAWTAILETAAGMAVTVPTPVPHPKDVTIDRETQRVTYRVPPKGGERATLENLRAGLARMEGEVARYRNEAAFATAERFAVAARLKRDELLELCGVIEGSLEGVEEERDFKCEINLRNGLGR